MDKRYNWFSRTGLYFLLPLLERSWGIIVDSFPANKNKQKKAAQSKIARAVVSAARSTVKKMPASPMKQVAKLGLGAASAGPKKLGGYIGGRIAKLSGRGDYTETNATTGDVKVNSLMTGAPQMGTFDNQGSVRVKHREFLNDILSGPVGVFSNSYVYNVNPGLHSFSPFLSAIASNYEKYAIRGMAFEFVSATSPYASSGSLGTWMMAMEYNAASSAFTSKLAMENSDQCISARLDHCGMYGIECKPGSFATDWLYVRSALNPVSIPSGTPINFVDAGLFQFAMVSSIPAGLNMGELWVTYDIELANPRLQTVGSLDNILYMPFSQYSADGAMYLPATLPLYISNDYQSVFQQTFLGTTYEPSAPLATTKRTDPPGALPPSGVLTVPGADNQLAYLFDIVFHNPGVDPGHYPISFGTNSDWQVTYVTVPNFGPAGDVVTMDWLCLEVRIDYVGDNGGRFQTPLLLGWNITLDALVPEPLGYFNCYIRGSCVPGGSPPTAGGFTTPKATLEPMRNFSSPKGSEMRDMLRVGSALAGAADDKYASERRAHGVVRTPSGRL